MYFEQWSLKPAPKIFTLGQNIIYMMHFHLPSGGNLAGENLRNDQHDYQLIDFEMNFFFVAGDRKWLQISQNRDCSMHSTAFQEIYLVLRKVIIVGLATFFLGPEERIKILE